MHQFYGFRFDHHNDPTTGEEHELLQHQCNYLQECLSEPTGVNYIMISHGWPFTVYKPMLYELRDIIPKDCKMMYCRIGNRQSDIDVINNIHVADVYDQNCHAKITDRWDLNTGLSVRYAKSKALKDAVDEVFLS